MTDLARPFVSLCIATSLDGKINETPDAAPAFTSAYDREKLFKLRAQADGLLIGANTVRQEGLLPLIRNRKLIQMRHDLGLSDHPDVILVSDSMNLPWKSIYFEQSKQKILVLTGVPNATAKQSASQTDTPILTTGNPLNLSEGLKQLKALGYQKILCEGGGTLVASMLSLDVVDRIYLTIAATFIGGFETPSLIKGEVFKPRLQFHLTESRNVDSELHLIYQRHAN